MSFMRALIAIAALVPAACLLGQTTSTPETSRAKANAPQAPIDLSARRLMKNALVSQALGFYDARLSMIDRATREYPEYADRLGQVRSRFVAAYSPCYTDARDELRARSQAEADAYELFLRTEVPKQTAKAELSKALTEQALATGTFEPDKQFNDSSRILRTFSPVYREHPERELTDKSTQPVLAPVMNDEGKALEITAPLSWLVLRVNKDLPNTRMVCSTVGIGPAQVVMQANAREDSKPGDRELLKRVVDDFLAKRPAKEILSSNIQRCATGELAACVDSLMELTAQSKTYKSLSRMTIIPRAGVLVLITEQVYDPDPKTMDQRTREELEACKAGYQPLFDEMLKTVRIVDAPAKK